MENALYWLNEDEDITFSYEGEAKGSKAIQVTVDKNTFTLERQKQFKVQAKNNPAVYKNITITQDPIIIEELPFSAEDNEYWKRTADFYDNQDPPIPEETKELYRNSIHIINI